MSLFEFLMILLSIIIGLGIAELLTGIASVIRQGRLAQMDIAHWALFLTMFLVLLQIFWESWSLNVLTSWTFPAMVLMLLAPVLVHLVTHLLFPQDTQTDLADHYYGKARVIYTLLIFTAVAGVLFRPLAFGYDLFVIDNLSTAPVLVALIILAWTDNRLVHRILAPLCLIAVAIDTLAISFIIS